MKKIYGFLGAAAILTMAACTKDVDGLASATPEAQGDLYMTMTISAQANTRTETESQGKEVGKDRENEIKSGLLIIAYHDVPETSTTDNGFKTVSYATIETGNIVGTSPNYAASFQMAREDLLAQFTEEETEKEYYLFLIANPTEDIIKNYIDESGPKKNISVQSLFELNSDTETYWSMTTGGKFLMTSASISKTTIYKSELAPGKHTTKADALHLGEVEVQRAMSRFDLAVDDAHTIFKAEDYVGDEGEETPGETTVEGVKFTFDAVALINQATSANIFKEVGIPVSTENKGSFFQNGNGTMTGRYGYFHKELKTVYTSTGSGDWTVVTSGNYVFAPDQTAVAEKHESSYINPLFNGTDNNQTDGTHVGHKSFFESTSTYTSIASLQGEGAEGDNDFTMKDGKTQSDYPDYTIWRYSMPNANFTLDNQVNGNSTGIVFRAKMEGAKITAANKQPIYAYNNIILGTFEDLKTGYGATAEKAGENATDGEKEIFEMVKVRYAEALKQAKAEDEAKAKENNGGEELPGDYEFQENATTLNDYLVAQGFTIYRPDNDGNFYCYYVYWNRHNDNGNNTVMNIMEFAAVRNNIYKIAVNKITKLGHPGQPDDDPDPEDPGTPDEKSEFWGEITCKVLDWEVRINNVEF